MKRRSLVSITITVLTMLTVASASRGAIQQSDISADEYAVYDAVIDTMFADNKVTFDFGGGVTVNLLVIEKQTVVDAHIYADRREDRWHDYRGTFPSIGQETVDEYAAKNKQSQFLKPSFKLKVKYVIVGATELNGGPGSEDFYKKFDGSQGYISLSRAGFNRDHSQALVYMSYECGSLCGHGFVLFLTKSRGEWNVVGKFSSWIS